MKAHLKVPAFLLAVAAAWTPAREAPAQSASSERSLTKAEVEAETRFKRGVELYKDGDFGPALIEFRRAYELAPSFKILYNIGQVEYQLQNYAGAFRALQKYLAEGGKEIAKERRAAVEAEIEKLKYRVGSVELSATVEGAEVTVDDVGAGRTPLSDPLLVSAGRRRITLSKEGRTATKVVDVGGGDVVQLSLELPEAPPAGPNPAVVSPPPPTPSGGTEPQKGSLVWLPWVATGAFGAGAIATGVLALGTANQFTEMQPTPNNQQDRADLQGKAVTLAIVTDVLAGAAVVMGGISIYMTVRAGKSNPPAQSGDRPTASIAVTAGPARVGLVGTF